MAVWSKSAQAEWDVVNLSTIAQPFDAIGIRLDHPPVLQEDARRICYDANAAETGVLHAASIVGKGNVERVDVRLNASQRLFSGDLDTTGSSSAGIARQLNHIRID
jgi:hypothetical protein